MFRTTRMQKLRVVFPQRVHDRVVAGLHEAGMVQLKEVSEVEVARRAIGEQGFELSSVRSRFAEMEELLGPPAGKPTVVKELTSERTLKLAKKTLAGLEPKVKLLKERKDGLNKHRQDLLTQIEMLKGFREIRFPMKYLRSTDEIHVAVGRMAEEEVEEFSDATGEALAQRVSVSVIGAGKRRTVIVACRAQDYQKLSPVLYRYEVELLELPPFTGSPSAAIVELTKQLAGVERQLKELDKTVRKLARAKAMEVSGTRELLDVQKERLECTGLFGYTDATAVIEGWVKAGQVAGLERILADTTGGRYVLRTYDPQKDEMETVPVEMKNPRVVEDFEFVTGMYGLPKYDEVDPTPVMSITFALFFGIALADVGYGIALAIFMASGVWFAKMFSRKLRRMMIMCAIFSIIAGIMLGGWFGFGQGVWANPIQRPVPLLKLVIFIGIIHLLVAFGIVGALKDVFRRDWKNIVFSRVSSILIMVGLFGLGFCALGIGLHEFGIDFAFPKTEVFTAFSPIAPVPGIVVLFRVLFYLGLGIGAGGAVITAKDAKGRVGRPLNFVYTAIVGSISDVSSYTRLMALSIAGSVIAFSINLILGRAYHGMMPAEITPLTAVYAAVLVIGFAFVFIAAHSFNIFLSSLGAFIHTMRLHFMEFFGKFYESGGERFAPFKDKRRFTQVEGGEYIGGR